MARIVRIDHIAFAVNDSEQATASAMEKYGAKLIIKYDTKEEKYNTTILQFGESMVSLLTPIANGGFVKDFLEKKGEGLHHLGLEVDDLEEYVKELESEGIRVPVKQFESNGRKEALVGPKNPFGVVLQLIEWKGGADVPANERIHRMEKYHSI